MKRIIAGVLGGILLICSLGMNTFAEEQKYQELYDYLEAGDYDAAIEYIQNLKVENDSSLPEDLSDYLLEVELTEENFEDYFEWRFYHQRNDFGEETEILRGNYYSKMYDQGYYLYKMDEIPIEYSIITGSGELDTRTDTLYDGYFGSAVTARSDDKGWELVRLRPGKIVYIKKEAVTRIEEGPYDADHDTVKLIVKNGDETEEIYRYYIHGFDY